MLPLLSTATTSSRGMFDAMKWPMPCSTPFSNTRKAFLGRFLTKRPEESVTVTVTWTASTSAVSTYSALLVRIVRRSAG